MKISIDGRFVTRRFGGQERFAYELLYELDKLVPKNSVELVVPLSSGNVPEYKNIEVVRFGKHNGLVWEQFDYWKYLRKNDRVSVYLCNTWPLFRPDIATIHDVAMLAMPKAYHGNLYGVLSQLLHTALFKSAAKRAKVILTISDFSKKDIMKILHIPADKIRLISCGWQHFSKITSDDSIFDRHKELVRGQYFLSASSITPQKNFKWVKESAKNNTGEVYAIAGKRVGLTSEKNAELDNLIYLGEVTDGEMRALMENCKAFIHPAKYEGFGMTPMEAMSVGAPIILSNATCLPEIYGDAAHYINPDDANIDLNELLKNPVEPAEKVLSRYSWEKGAHDLLEAFAMYTHSK
ncbi:MAG: glycosyltransferase family 4 protein [Oscillospiraceae bacterium]|nr:glycosyltransferase family 4 protein [Oscillospiraceae bacterium]